MKINYTTPISVILALCLAGLSIVVIWQSWRIHHLLESFGDACFELGEMSVGDRSSLQEKENYWSAEERKVGSMMSIAYGLIFISVMAAFSIVLSLGCILFPLAQAARTRWRRNQ